MALRHTTGALEYLQQLKGSGGGGDSSLRRLMVKLAFLELLVASLLAQRDLVCRRQAQRLGSLQGPEALPLPHRLKWTGKKAFLSNARQEEINETNTISKGTP